MDHSACSAGEFQRRICYLLTVFILSSSQLLPQTQTALMPVGSLDSAAFTGVRLNGRYSLMEFGGRNCIPCRQMQPLLAELSAKYGPTVNIFNVYMDRERDLFREYRITLIPTQIIFDKSGKEIARHAGYWEKDKLLAELKKLRIIP